MSTGTIKAIQQSGSTWEILFAADDGNAYRVATNGTRASLVAGLQSQALGQAATLKSAPELIVGQTVDYTPVVPVQSVLTPEQQARSTFTAAYVAWRTETDRVARGSKGGFALTDNSAALLSTALKAYQQSYEDLL